MFAGSMRRDGLAVACMGIDGQPLSLVPGNAGSESGGGNALVAEHLRESLQSFSQGKRACISGALQGVPVEGNAKGVSPRILTKMACMEESNGMIW